MSESDDLKASRERVARTYVAWIIEKLSDPRNIVPVEINTYVDLPELIRQIGEALDLEPPKLIRDRLLQALVDAVMILRSLP